MKDRFDLIVQHIDEELATLHPGRVSPSMIENTKVLAYGAESPLNQLASITSLDAHTLLIQPWDSSVIKDIEKGLREAGRDYNPVVDGKTIRLSFPPLTEEKRRDYVRMMHEICEQGHVSVKKVREEIMNELKEKKANKEMSEDVFFAEQKSVQKIVDEYNETIKERAKLKETELMTI